jgi:hypothetical protein
MESISQASPASRHGEGGARTLTPHFPQPHEATIFLADTTD